MASFRKRRKDSPVWFILPTVIVLLAISIAPLIYSLGGSFYDWSIMHTERGMTLTNNYGKILGDPFFWKTTMLITVNFTIFAVIMEFALGFLLAMLVSRNLRGMSIFKVVFVIPVFMMPVAVGLLWKYMYNPSIGIINWILSFFNIPIIKWVSAPSTALLSIAIVDIWQWTPFMFLLLLAGFQSVPRGPIEAAMIDGASYPTILRHIALPHMKPVILVAILIRTMDAFREFDKIKILTDGGPGFVTSNLYFQTFLQAFRFFEMGYSMALSWICAIFIIIITTILVSRIRR